MQQLPLFPLNTVLFPGAQLPLHVFEPRYRLMIGRCIEEQKPFGVVLIREGVEVGGTSIPHLVGTIASIENAYRLADGRMYIISLGQRRFRINYPLSNDPYLVAMVSLLDDEHGDPAQAAEVLAIYDEHRRKLMAATGMKAEPLDLPSTPLELGYALADRMQVAMPVKQRWLESSVGERLRAIGGALRTEMQLLPPLPPNLPDREPPFDTTSWN
ncbi:MAG TPA: LON peptidase substrate-binding domain-containing protein [Herpetosiphonaceae bacterium]